MAELSVPDGSRCEDLGINLRRIVGTIRSVHVLPHIADLKKIHEHLRTEVRRRRTHNAATSATISSRITSTMRPLEWV
jgi:hypothetical protein